MDIVAIANQKGGCGKTTTAVNLSACLAQRGYKVLLIDLDPQAHATLGLGIDPFQLRESIYDVLVNADRSISEIVRTTSVPNLHIAPSHILLSGADLDLNNVVGREGVLKDLLKKVDPSFEYILIDCSPSLNIVTVNALTAATQLLVPIQAQYYAMEGMKQLFSTVDIIRRHLNSELKILGILITMYDGRTKLCRDVASGIREYFKNKVFQTMVNSNVKLGEAPSAGQPITVYDPLCAGARDYQQLTNEMLAVSSGRTYVKPEAVHESVIASREAAKQSDSAVIPAEAGIHVLDSGSAFGRPE